MQKSCLNRRGYILVLTLGLLVLAATSLSSLARFSLGLAMSARESADELQRRWGLLSVRHFMTERAAEILDSQVPSEKANTPPWPKPSSLEVRFQLGDQRFSVLMADEDAKASLNAIHSRKPEQIIPVIQRLSGVVGAGHLPLRLRPENNSRRAFTSWGQVVESASPSETNDRVATKLVAIGQEITCWGSGRLNLRRASDSAVREVAALALPANKVGELLEHRRHWGGGDVESLLSELSLRRPQLLAAGRLFSAESRSYSIWVEIDNGQRSWSHQFVEDGGPVCFAW